MSSSDSTETEPWRAIQPYLKDLFSRGQARSEQPLGYFPGSTVAGRSAASLEGEEAGLGMIRGTDMGGLGAADSYLTDVMGGKFLGPDSNPHLKDMANTVGNETTRHYMRAIAPQTSMAGRGRGGSGAEMNLQGRGMEALAQELYEGQTNIYGGHYEKERGRMGSAAGMMPGISSARRGDVTTGYALGEGAERYDQRLIDEMVSRFEFGRDEEGMRLGQFNSLLQGYSGAGGTSEVNRGFGAAEGGGLGVGLLGAVASMMSACSRAIKDELDDVNPDRILKEVAKLPIKIWKYKDEIDAADHQPHIGPYAEDMQRLFGLGNGREIFLMDAIGVALASVQALSEANDVLTKRVGELEVQLLPQQLEEVG